MSGQAKDFIMGSPGEPTLWEVRFVRFRHGERTIIVRYGVGTEPRRVVPVADIEIPPDFTDEQITLAVKRLKQRIVRAEIVSPPGSDWFSRERAQLELWLEKRGLLDVQKLLDEGFDVKKFIANNQPSGYVLAATLANGERIYKGGEMHWVDTPEEAIKYTNVSGDSELKIYQDGGAQVAFGGQRAVKFELLPISEGLDTKAFIMQQPPPELDEALPKPDAVKKFIMGQPEWSFKVEFTPEAGFGRYHTHIYFQRHVVCSLWTGRRPRTDRWKRGLMALNRQEAFELNAKYAFNAWLRRNDKRLNWDGLRALSIYEDADAARNFIKTYGNEWTFVDSDKAAGMYSRTMRIYCNGTCVAGFHYTNEIKPEIEHMKLVLELCDQTHPFRPGKDNFYTWLKDCGRSIFPGHWKGSNYCPVGWGEIVAESEETFNPKDFIMHRLSTVNDICKSYGLLKTDDQYDDGKALWHSMTSHVTRAQAWRGEFRLNAEIADAPSPMKSLEVVVRYWEQAYPNNLPNNTIYDARIDIGVGARTKKLSTRNEFELALKVDKYLKRLKLALDNLYSTRRKQLERAVLAAGFRVREAKEAEKDASDAVFETDETRQFILDSPYVKGVCESWGLKETGHFTTPKPTTEHWRFKGTVQLPNPLAECDRVYLDVHYFVVTFNEDTQHKKEYHQVRLQTDLSPNAPTATATTEGDCAEYLQTALIRLQQKLTRTKATTLVQIQSSVNRWLAKGWPM